jgi:membrane protein implicated in regulation of membrane protease activity
VLHALNNSVALGVTMEWWWQIPAMMAGSVVATLALARVLAQLLGPRPAAPGPSGIGAAPATPVP